MTSPRKTDSVTIPPSITEQQAHVAIQRQHRLFLASYLLCVVLGYYKYPVYLALLHPPPCLAKINGITADFGVLVGINHPRQLTALRRTRVINNGHRHLFDQFRIIDQRVRYRICERQSKKKQQHSQIGKYQTIFVDPCTKQRPPPVLYIIDYA